MRSAAILSLGCLAACAAQPEAKPGPQRLVEREHRLPRFHLDSPQIQDGAMMSPAEEFNGFGAKGSNKSPGLRWSGAPAGTKSYAVTVHDPDAPTGSGWWHWQAWNIPAATSMLPQGAGGSDGQLWPAGMQQGRNDYGATGFGGACPPVGDPAHRYHFTVWALDAERLDVPPDASPALVGFMIRQHALAKAELVALYTR